MTNFEKIPVANLFITNITKPDLLATIRERVREGQKTWITTLYSEFIFYALKSPEIQNLLNKADISVADGIGMFLAKRYLQIPIKEGGYWQKHIQAAFQMASSLLEILFHPQNIKKVLPEKISGSELIWDLAKLAADNNLKIFLAGGFGDTPKLVAEKLKQKYPDLQIQYSNKNPGDTTLLTDIQTANPDMLLAAYGPLKQENWILSHKDHLPAKLYVGLGGTFDYLAGEKKSPPAFIRNNGLEWLWRLITQPQRIHRIMNATFGLCYWLIRYKVNTTLPYRKNVACIVLNPEGKIFLGKRKPDDFDRNNNHWMFPQGGLEEGEDIAKAAEREIWEETGLKSLRFMYLSDKTNTYSWLPGFSHDFRGQRQNIAYFSFMGNDAEINLTNHEVVEFESFQWVEPNKLMQTIHEFRKPLAELVIQDLKEMAEKGIINIGKNYQF